MLAADKLLLQSQIKQTAVELREKELKLHYENFNAVGTQAAVLAGFAMTSFAEIDLPHNAFYAQKVRPHRSSLHLGAPALSCRLPNRLSCRHACICA